MCVIIIELQKILFVKLSDINKIISILDKYPLHGAKLLDYLDFCKIAKLMNAKAHLTEEGLVEIRKIKAKMNTGRDIY